MDLKSIVTIAAILTMAPVSASPAEVRVAIEDIESLAMEKSPHAAILRSDLDLARADRDLAARWTNPSLFWEMEEVGDGDLSSREWVLGLEKEFAMPWSYSKSRGGADLRLESARLGWEASRWSLIAQLRHGYVTMKLLDFELRILESFEGLVEEGARVLEEKRGAGAISGQEQGLVDFSLIPVRARIIDTRVVRRDLMYEWKAAMGIAESDTVVLVTGLDLSATRVSPDKGPGGASSEVKSRRLAAEALEKEIGLAKAGLFPAVTLAGAYKNVDDEFDGFAVGISLPIPLLNRNSGEVELAAAEHRKAQVKLDLFEAARERRIRRLTDTAGEQAALLDMYHDDIAGIADKVSDLSASYNEGFIGLGDYLDGLQTYAGGIEVYFDLLESYHDLVFELEELAERELFIPGEIER